MDVRPARGLAYVRVGLKGRNDGFDVAGRKRALVLADDIELLEVGVWLQHGRAVGVPACQRPGAVVDAQLDDARVLVAVSRIAIGSSTRHWSPSSVSTVCSIRAVA
jgi:hypothetical protein